jgi:hypothetical protein
VVPSVVREKLMQPENRKLETRRTASKTSNLDMYLLGAASLETASKSVIYE